MNSRTVLIVAPTRPLASALSAWLADTGHDVDLVTSFADAKTQLAKGPCLMISEVRLGDYNGLHLAMRAHAHGIPAMVIGAPDSVLQREAERLGARYLTSDIERGDLLRAVEFLPTAAANGPRYPVATNLSFISASDVESMRDLGSLFFAPHRTLRPMAS